MLGVVYGWSTYCVDNKKGNVKKARIMRELTINELQKSVCLDRRGLKSLFLAISFLENAVKTIKDHEYKKYIYINVYIGDVVAFVIYYSIYKELKETFMVKENYKTLGVSKELTLYKNDLKDYFKDIFSKNPDLKMSRISIVNKKVENNFYLSQLGIVWNEEECAHATLKAINGEYLTKDEKKLVERKCYDKFKNRPDIKIFDIQEEKVKKNLKDFVKKDGEWECEVCSVKNPNNKSNCMACNAKKK